jgi:hypothetical protein
MSGCPGHTASIKLQSVSESLTFDDGKGQVFEIQTSELKAFAKVLSRLAEADYTVEAALKPLFEKEETHQQPLPPSESVGTALPFGECSSSLLKKSN